MAQLDFNKTHQVPYSEGYVSWHEFGSEQFDKLPLVLLHGGHGNWKHWWRNIDALAQHFRLFVPDMPGFGQSAYFGPQLQSDMLDPLRQTLDALLGIEQSINVAGFSFGGFVAAHLANQRKGVNKIALLGSAGHGGPRRPRGELIAWQDYFKNQAWHELTEVMRENLYQQMFSSYESIDPTAIEIHQEACIATRFKSKPIARPGGLAEQLEQIKGPVLLIWGEQDVTCTPDYLVAKFVNGRPNRQKAIIERAGHWVQYENSDEINALLVDWFK